MGTIYTRLPFIGEVETRCHGESVRCIVTSVLGTVTGRYAWFRSRKQYAALYRAVKGPQVKVDLNAAYVYALRLASEGKVCLDKDGFPVDCELCDNCQVWTGHVDFDRWTYVRSLANQIPRTSYTVVVGVTQSEWAVYWQFGSGLSGRCRRVAYTYSSLQSAIESLYKSGCAGIVVSTRDILKYGVLTNIGYTYWTGAPWIFDLAVSLTTSTLLRDIARHRSRVLAAYIDSVHAVEEVDLSWDHKVEDQSDNSIIVIPPVYAIRERYGLWGLGDCDVYERKETRQPWKYRFDIAREGLRWYYRWSIESLTRKPRPECKPYLDKVVKKAEELGVRWDPWKRTLKDVRPGTERLWEREKEGVERRV